MIVLTSPLKAVDRVAISPDGAFLAAAGGTQKLLVVWSLREPGQPRYRFPARFARRMWSFCFIPASGLLLTGDGNGITALDTDDGTEVWDIPTPNSYEYEINALDVARDGRELLFGLANGYRSYTEFQRWGLNGRELPARKRGSRGPDGEICRGVVLLPGATGFVSALDHPTGARTVDRARVVVDYQARLRVVNAAGRATHTLTTEFESVHQLAASAEGRLLAAQFPQAVLVWDLRAPAGPPRQLGPGKRVLFTGIAFHPSGKFLAATSNDRTVKLYDTATWQVARTFTWNVGRMRSVAFSPDGTLAAAGSDTGKVVVWDVDV